MYAFWGIEDEAQRTQELVNFTMNVALIGGADFAAAIPEAWRASARGGTQALVAT